MSTSKQISLLATLEVSFNCMMRGIGLDAADHFATKQPRHICRLQRGKSKYSLSFLCSRRCQQIQPSKPLSAHIEIQN